MFQLRCSDGKVRDPRWAEYGVVQAYAWALGGRPCSPRCPPGVHNAAVTDGDTQDASLTYAEAVEHLLTFTRAPFFEGAEWDSWLLWVSAREPDEQPRADDWCFLCPDGKVRLTGRKNETFVQFYRRMLAPHRCRTGCHAIVRKGLARYFIDTYPVHVRRAVVHR